MLSKFKVSINISWKKKLSIVIGVTLAGLVIVTVSAFSGLTSVTNSVEEQNSVAEYEKDSLALTNNLLKLEYLAATLSTESQTDFFVHLENLQQLATAMAAKADALNNNQINESSHRLVEYIGEYSKKRNEWLQNYQILGYSASGGALKELSDALEAFRKASAPTTEIEIMAYTLVEPVLNTLIISQAKYVEAKDGQSEASMEQALGELESLGKDLGWEGTTLNKTLKSYRQNFDLTRQLVNKERTINETMLPLINELSELVDQKNILLKDIVDAVAFEAIKNREFAMATILLVAIVVGIIMFFSLSGVSRQLNAQLGTMQSFFGNIAAGDLSEKLSTNDNKNDEFTQLRAASNQMVEDISRVISKVVSGNISLFDIRQQLENAVNKLATSSEELEQNAQHSTKATKQISVAVNQMAKRSVEVSETAQAASSSTQSGIRVINSCVDSMTGIAELIGDTNKEVNNLSTSSAKMLGIIDIINGLADQTNLLALNAAIESARAGEAGRGFSVVADEVRALAKKTVAATNNIGAIIKEFDDQSKQMGELMEKGITFASSGQDNANNAMVSFKEIENSIQKVVTEMDQMVVSVEEISYNTSDIAKQVEHIYSQTETTKETRLTMEEHSQELSSQAENLRTLTNRFKLASST